MNIPDTDAPEVMTEDPSEGIHLLEQIDRKTLQNLLREAEDPDLSRNTILSNGWSAGTFALTYLRMLQKRKLKYRKP